ncbi:MAG: hypothetical protein J6A15_01575 [Clostridia bacterium]|nr:hypothetical protein [Clostridia bacterium]
MINNNKKTMILFITVVFIILFSTIFAVEITHFAPEYGVTTANVNLRNKPTTNYSSFVRTLQPNTKIKVVGSLDNFYIVQLESNEVGIISKDYVKITGEKTNSYTYTDYSPFYATVKGNNTIVRGGPSTSFKVYGKLNSGDKVYVIGAINNFLLVITDNNLVGMIREDLIEYTANNQEEIIVEEQNPNLATTPEYNANIYYILEKINAVRNENGLPSLTLDSLITATAQTKARDMVENNYFSHNSPTYGSPFVMMKNAGITYKTAGENIAGNNNLDDAINSFLDSPEHSQNILSNSYNYIGIGLEKSDTYGYIIVLMFVGK